MQTVIVSVSFKGEEKDWIDLELPLESTAEQISPILGKVLHDHLSNLNVPTQQYNIEFKISGGDWSRLDPDNRLMDEEICDGAFLRIEPVKESLDCTSNLNAHKRGQIRNGVKWRPIDTEIANQAETNKQPNQGYVWRILE